MNLRFIHDNLYPLLAALILIAATSAWFGITVPQMAETRTTDTEAWHLPQQTEQTSKASLEAINARNLWGVVLESDAAKEPEWRVLGIAISGANRFILLAYEGKPVEMLKVGDTLPDGTKIVQIEKDRFFVKTANNKKIAFGIYKHDPAK